MIKNRAELKKYLLEDSKKNRIENINSINGRFQYYIRLMVGSEQTHALRYLRVLRHYEYWLNQTNESFFKYCCKIMEYWYKIRWQRLGLKYGINIGPNMVGYGLKIPHIAGGIIINCLHMGNFCSVNSGVVIGSHKNKRPLIGNNCLFCIGAKIYGDINIGNNVKVAPNSVVYTNVDSNCIVVNQSSVLLTKKNNTL